MAALQALSPTSVGQQQQQWLPQQQWLQQQQQQSPFHNSAFQEVTSQPSLGWGLAQQQQQQVYTQPQAPWSPASNGANASPVGGFQLPVSQAQSPADAVQPVQQQPQGPPESPYPTVVNALEDVLRSSKEARRCAANPQGAS